MLFGHKQVKPTMGIPLRFRVEGSRAFLSAKLVTSRYGKPMGEGGGVYMTFFLSFLHAEWSAQPSPCYQGMSMKSHLMQFE